MTTDRMKNRRPKFLKEGERIKLLERTIKDLKEINDPAYCSYLQELEFQLRELKGGKN